MMDNVKIIFRDDSIKEFKYNPNSINQNRINVIFEGNFTTVIDQYYRKFSYPIDTIKEIIQNPGQY